MTVTIAVPLPIPIPLAVAANAASMAMTFATTMIVDAMQVRTYANYYDYAFAYEFGVDWDNEHEI